MPTDKKYERVVDELRKQILNHSGELIKNGRAIVSEQELTRIFEVSRVTVRHALTLLETEGLVVKQQGAGTFVNPDVYRYAPPKYNRIGLVFPDVPEETYPYMVSGAINFFSQNGYKVVKKSFKNNSFAGKRSALQEMLSEDIDGLIIECLSAMPDPNDDIYKKFEAAKLPIVFVDGFRKNVHACCAYTDDRGAVKSIMDHLVSLGHKNIAGIFTVISYQHLMRYQGYVDAIIEHHLPYNDKHVMRFTDQAQINAFFDASFKETIDHLLECTAIVCTNDNVAKYVEATLKRAGIDVPSRMSITGVDNIPARSISSSKLTTVDHPKERLGTEAAKMLYNMMETQQDVPDVRLPMPLIIGNTTAKPFE